MPESSETTQTVKTASDGTVQIAVEKYTELLETINTQKDSIRSLRGDLTRARNEPPMVINRTVIEKTPEMLAKEQRVWGNTCMGVGGSLFIIGALLRKAGSSAV